MPSTSSNSLSRLSTALIDTFENQKSEAQEEKISVNILVSKLAAWYEKLRTAMDYGNEETILRRAIERILKRRLFLASDPNDLAGIVIRELIWGGYFPNDSVPQSSINRVADSIGLYLKLKDELSKQKKLGDEVYDFIIQILSCEIHTILAYNSGKEAMANFMFHVLRDSVEILDDSKQTRDVQVFISVRKNFARDDLAFLQYRLFTQIFGRLSDKNFKHVSDSFSEGFKEINHQLSYTGKDRIFTHVKRVTPPFLILYDLLKNEKGNLKTIIKNESLFKSKVFASCDKKYGNIKNKIRTAIIRSFIFILFTKAFIALFIEGTFEKIFYGQIQWLYIGLNTIIPPVLMVVAGLGIKTPKEDNSEIIYLYIQKLLFEENPSIVKPLAIYHKPNKKASLGNYFFSILWLFAIGLSFGLIMVVLTKLHFNILSQGIFLFFIAIISFLTYRIYQTANSYSVIFVPNLFTPILDFFLVPIIRVGRRLTEGMAQINFILIVVDFIIEAPFKGLVGFFEQWFIFLAAKREELE